MKCPACGFDNPDEASWCDFCKEPFRKRPAAGPPGAPKPLEPVPPGFPPTAAAPAEVKSNGAHIPSEFAHLDPGERVPSVAPWVRLAAWAFLALWFIMGMVLLGYYMGKQGMPRDSLLKGASNSKSR